MEVPNLHKTKVYMMFATRDFSFIDINSQFFLKMDQCQPQPNCKTQPLWVWGIRIVPNVHTLVGFAIGALGLATMTTLHLRALHKTKTCSLEGIFISCQPRLKKTIYYNCIILVTLLNVVNAK